MTAENSASGWFDQHNWWVQSHGADPSSILLASAHESNHRQLQYSTVFGALTLTMHRLSNRTDDGRSTIVSSFVKCSEAVHEAFATWCSITALGRLRADLADYSLYLRHWDAADRLVGGIESPYIRFHAVHAIARVCMQAPTAQIALDVGLDRLGLCDVAEKHRPDHRFVLLRRRPPSWNAAIAELGRIADDDAMLQELIERPELAADSFDTSRHEHWQTVNRVLYQHIADHLTVFGCETVPHEGHLEWTKPLLNAAERIIGGTLDILPGHERDPRRAAHQVLRNVESEGFINGPHLRARRLRADTEPTDLVGALGDDAHLFVSVRPASEQVLSYNLDDGDNVGDADVVTVVLRRTVIDEDGLPTVEILDVTDRSLADIEDQPHPVLALISMSLLNNAGRWGDLISVDRSAVLIDRSLGAHLDQWLATSGTEFHYCLLRLQSFDRVLPVLIGQLHVRDAGSSHLMVRPLSDAAIRIHKAAFEEIDPTGQVIVADPTMLDTGKSFLPLILAHIVGEETRFSPVAT